MNEKMQELIQNRKDRKMEISLSNACPGIAHYGPPLPKIGGTRISRKPRLDEMDEERQC